MIKAIKFLLGAFFACCVLIHVYGLFTHFNNESDLSHVVHIISYIVCGVAVVVDFRFRLWVYVAGAVYPFAFHLNCFWEQYDLQQKINGICLLVVVLLPLAGIWLRSQTGRRER